MLAWASVQGIAAEVRVAESDTIADLGCGRGGPGLWVAMATGADLVGIDISSTALEETEDWRRRISDTTAGMLENAAELATESGQDVETTTERLREMQATIECMSRRILVVARAR